MPLSAPELEKFEWTWSWLADENIERIEQAEGTEGTDEGRQPDFLARFETLERCYSDSREYSDLALLEPLLQARVCQPRA